MDPRTRVHRSRLLPKIVGSVVERARGGLLIVFRSGLAFFDPESDEIEMLNLDMELGDERFNDAKCDAEGRLWVGTLHRELKSDQAALYRITPDRLAKRMDAPFSIGNGLDWSPDLSKMYFTDTRTKIIYVYDFDRRDGTLENRRIFARLEDGHMGRPDGCTIDAEGFLWSAIVGGGRLARFDPTGKLAEEVMLPILNPTSCCFGGPDLKTLFITSARETSVESEEHRPLEGGLFAFEPKVGGVPTHAFSG